MSEGRRPETSEEDGASAAEAGVAAPEESTAEPQPTPPRPASPRPSPALWWLAGLLALVVAAVAASPFWAPPIAALLPWAPRAAGSNAALAARLKASEKAAAGTRADLAAVQKSQAAIRRRLDRLTSNAGNTAPAAAMAQLQQSVGKLAKDVQALQARPAIDPTRLDKIEKQIAQLDARSASLAARLPAIERQLHAEQGAQRREAAMLTALLQMRGAVATGRPFADSYDAFAALARGRPALLAAAKPLASAARDGVADRATLKQRLAALAEHFAHAAAPPPASDWGSEALRRLRSLVTIRRTDAPPATPGEAAVKRASAALDRGDLAGAVAALATLTGAEAEAARPWLALARQRLAAEVALDKLQRLLLADLAGAGSTPAAAPAKSGAAPKAGSPS